MRSLSIQLLTLFALLPALGTGCAMKSGHDEGTASYADAKVAMEPGYGGAEYEAAAPAEAGGYDYADDMAGDYAGEAAPPPTAAPAPMADEAPGRAVATAEEAPASPSAAGVGSARKSGAGKDKSSRADRGADGEGGEMALAPKPKKEAKLAAERDRNIQSGTLTAGSFDDNLNPWVFDRFIDQARNHPDLAALASAFAGQRTTLRVQDAQGRPIGNAEVEIDGKRMMTRSDGRVVWVSGWDGGRQAQGKATISHGNARATISINDQFEQLVTLKDAKGTLPSKLDIALVIDATGSMGDELEYLKVEIRDIAEAINRHFPGVDQRFALVVYRDQGDQYVTRTFDFTGNLDAFQSDLENQFAGGGGDYPEAMDDAMEAAAQLSWRKGDAARVTFLVADAPPHANDFDDTLDAVDSLRSKGVAVYPVASSGVAGEAEFVMRTAAMLTGAQYLFLTDDSGVGNPHAEPHIPCYTVEQLAPLMVRAVRSELSGHRVEPEPQFSIRTVGKGQSGVCEQPRSNTKIAK